MTEHFTLYRVTHVHYCKELIPNNATIKMCLPTETHNCLLQKSVKIQIYLNDTSLINDLAYLCTKWTNKELKSMPSYQLHTSNDAEEIYTGKH